MDTEGVLRLLAEAYDRFWEGDLLGYDAALAQAKEHIGSSREERWLRGEWKLLASYALVRDQRALCRMLDEIIVDMDGRQSRIITADSAYGFSNDSVFWPLLRDPGQAERTGKLLEKTMDRYQILTGSGQGYAELYRAEMAYQRGDIVKARTLAYQATYVAMSTRQSRLAVTAAKQIGHIAIYTRDIADWRFAVETIIGILESQTESRHVPSRRGVALLSYAEVMITLDNLTEVPAFVRDGRFGVSPGVGFCNLKFKLQDPNITAFDYPLALWLHALYLMKTGQLSRALAVDTVQRMFGIEKEFLCYQLYYSLLRGTCYLAMGDRGHAEAEFASAVELAAPDGLWLTVAEFAPHSGGLVLEAVKNCGGDTELVRRLSRGIADNVQKLKEAVMGQDTDQLLTAREKEIAAYAAEGLRNKEIADKLSITEQTVKFHLSNIYSKLDINNRAKLAATLKSQAQRLY